MIDFKYIKGTLANNYFANQKSLASSPFSESWKFPVSGNVNILNARSFVADNKKFIFHPQTERIRSPELKNDWILNEEDWLIHRLYRIITRH